MHTVRQAGLVCILEKGPSIKLVSIAFNTHLGRDMLYYTMYTVRQAEPVRILEKGPSIKLVSIAFNTPWQRYAKEAKFCLTTLTTRFQAEIQWA